jgi:hypothetical protein
MTRHFQAVRKLSVRLAAAKTTTVPASSAGPKAARAKQRRSVNPVVIFMPIQRCIDGRNRVKPPPPASALAAISNPHGKVLAKARNFLQESGQIIALQ